VESLQHLLDAFPDAPEPVLVGARQLLLEIERRERGTLDEVATLLAYAAARLKVADAAERVRKRQKEAVALLDRLIQEAEQREKKRCKGGPAKPGKPVPKRAPRPRKRSEAPGGGGRVGDLHGADKAKPGDIWGKLPPAEREKILQSLRDRFPSRYRQLVEQYYRSLAEEK
jgi:hypothetical protein